MNEGICKLDGCERPRFNRGWCAAHWNRVRRNGDPGSPEVREHGRSGCLVDGCDGEHVGHGYCELHRRHFVKHGDPLVVLKKVALLGSESEAWVGDAATYAAVHWRLTNYRQPASVHQCVECTSQAAEWAYQHNAVDERTDPKCGLPYSTNLDDYSPMCRSCHRRLDAANRYSLADG